MALYFYINPRLQIRLVKKVLRTIYIVEIVRVAFLVSKYRPWTYFTSNFIGSSLPVIVCRMAHVIRHIYVISVCLRIVVSNASWLYAYHDGCLIRSRICFTLCEQLCSPPVYGGVRICSSFWFLIFCCGFFFFYLRLSCVSNAASVSRLFILYCSFGFL